MRFICSQRARAAILTLLVMCSGCITKTHTCTFEVKRGTTIEEKLRLAQSVATQQRLDLLKRELKNAHPDLSEEQLERIGIRWNERWAVGPDGGKTDRSVTLQVIMEAREGADTSAVVLTAARILDLEINGPDHRAIDPE